VFTIWLSGSSKYVLISLEARNNLTCLPLPSVSHIHVINGRTIPCWCHRSLCKCGSFFVLATCRRQWQNRRQQNGRACQTISARLVLNGNSSWCSRNHGGPGAAAHHGLTFFLKKSLRTFPFLMAGWQARHDMSMPAAPRLQRHWSITIRYSGTSTQHDTRPPPPGAPATTATVPLHCHWWCFAFTPNKPVWTGFGEIDRTFVSTYYYVQARRIEDHCGWDSCLEPWWNYSFTKGRWQGGAIKSKQVRCTHSALLEHRAGKKKRFITLSLLPVWHYKRLTKPECH